TRLRADRLVRGAVEEVVAEPEAVDPAVLGLTGELEDLGPGPAGAVLRGLRQRDSHSHRSSLDGRERPDRRPVETADTLDADPTMEAWRRPTPSIAGPAPGPDRPGSPMGPATSSSTAIPPSARCSAIGRSGCRPGKRCWTCPTRRSTSWTRS